jgi:hypothetical protein
MFNKKIIHKSGLDIASKVKIAVQDKRYKIVTDPKLESVMIQANILQVGKSILEDQFELLSGGYGSGLAGFDSGATLGGAFGSSVRGILGVGLLAGAASTILDAAVEVVNFTMITNLQISEKADSEIIDERGDANLKKITVVLKRAYGSLKTIGKRYQTRIMSVAKKTNLKFEEAAPELVSGILIASRGFYEDR